MDPGSIFAPGFGGAITITDRRWRVHVRNISTVVERAMRAAKCHADVVLTDDRTIKRLNARDRARNKPTNVLTYEQPPEILLGVGVVLREARAERVWGRHRRDLKPRRRRPKQKQAQRKGKLMRLPEPARPLQPRQLPEQQPVREPEEPERQRQRQPELASALRQACCCDERRGWP